MPQIVPAGSINLAALTDPDVYVQVLQPPSFIRGVPTDVIGLVGTAAWGPTNMPVSMGTGQDAQLAFGPISSTSVLDPFDIATDLYLAFGQAQSTATIQAWGVRVTDGTDTAASVALTGAASATPATATISGTVTTGDVLSLTATSTGITGSPVTVSYTTKAGDTLSTIATALAAAVNNSPALNAAAIYGSAAGAVATLYAPASLSPAVVWTRNVTGAATETITIGTGTASTAGATATARYTGSLGSQIKITLAASPSVLNATNVTVSGFQGTAELFLNIGNANFWRNLQSALANGQLAQRGPSQWATLTTINAAVGVPAMGTYNLTGGTDGRSVTTSQMLGSSTATPRTGLWSLSTANPPVSIVWLTGVTDQSAVATLDSFALNNGASALFPLPTGISTASAVTTVLNDGIGGPEFAYVKDFIYFQDTVNNLRRLVPPTAVIGGRWACLSPEQSPLNKQTQLVLGTERTDPVNGNLPYSPSEIGQLNSAGVMFVTNPIPAGSVFGIRTGATTSPLASTQPAEYWRLTMFIARSLDANMGQFEGQLQSTNPIDPLRDQVRAVLNGFGETLAASNIIQSGIGFCEYSSSPNAKYGNGVNTPTSIAQHYLYALFRATYLSSVWYFIISVQGGTTVVTVAPGQA